MAKKTAEKVGGKFQHDSEIGRMYTFLSDGKPHSKEETIKAVKPKTGRIINKTKKLMDWGKESKLYAFSVWEDGMLQMTTSHSTRPAKKSQTKRTKTTTSKAAEKSA